MPKRVFELLNAVDGPPFCQANRSLTNEELAPYRLKLRNLA